MVIYNSFITINKWKKNGTPKKNSTSRFTQCDDLIAIENLQQIS